jgi:hypothetical protein
VSPLGGVTGVGQTKKNFEESEMTQDDNDRIKSAEEATTIKVKVDQLDRSLSHLISTTSQVMSSTGTNLRVLTMFDTVEALQQDVPGSRKNLIR